MTTTNAPGWAQTGRRMAQSVMDRWPAEALPLTVYAEGFEPDVAGVELRRLPRWIDDFKAWNSGIATAIGRRGGGYDYRFDAVKFAHKVAAVTDFGLSLADGVMIWLDADTYTHAPVTTTWLASLFPAPGYIAWLDRLHTHPECGFLMFRCDHPSHRTFMEAMRDIYVSGEVFRLRETHDSFVFQHLVTTKVSAGEMPAPVSLSGEARRTSHPFANGRLAECMDHMKGPRKNEGRSRPRDLVRPRPEPYWNACTV